MVEQPLRHVEHAVGRVDEALEPVARGGVGRQQPEYREGHQTAQCATAGGGDRLRPGRIHDRQKDDASEIAACAARGSHRSR